MPKPSSRKCPNCKLFIHIIHALPNRHINHHSPLGIPLYQRAILEIGSLPLIHAAHNGRGACKNHVAGHTGGHPGKETRGQRNNVKERIMRRKGEYPRSTELVALDVDGAAGQTNREEAADGFFVEFGGEDTTFVQENGAEDVLCGM